MIKKIKRKISGFTLIELVITVCIVGILTSIAYPSYLSYVKKTKARSAASDLVSLSLIIENYYQLNLAYTAYSSGTTVTSTVAPNFNPTQSAVFNYTIASTISTYTLTATGTGSLSGCNITLNQANTRTSTSTCGFSSW